MNQEERQREIVRNQKSGKATEVQIGSHAPQNSTRDDPSLLVFWDLAGLVGSATGKILPRARHGESQVCAAVSCLDEPSSCELLFPLQDAFDLLEVIEVVTGHHVQDALDGFLAALGVHPVVLPLFRFQRFEDH
jgi:hypothetical protein